MEGFTNFEKAVLIGQNKQLQIFRVGASTVHRGVEILSTQAHTGLTEVTPLLQRALAMVRLSCSSRLVQAALWPS